jgi:polysaccharide export outer membrane protein
MGAALLCALAAAQEQRRPAASTGQSDANLPAQKIGANDLIAVSVYDAPELSRTVRISSDGDIRLPMLKHNIRALGLLPADLETAIADALTAEQVLVAPVVTVTVVEYRSRPVSVAGAVKDPLTFQANGPVTLLEAIARAGGLRPDAGREILVSRRQAGADGTAAVIRRIPVKALIDAADPEANLTLTGGEEIRVPEIGRVFVLGNVKKPGSYPVQDASETTVMKMLALAEGLAPYAAKEAYIIRRGDGAGAKTEVPVELRKIMQRKSPDVQLAANDILYVPDNTGRRVSIAALEKITGFAAATASGVIIWGRP